MTYPRSYLVLFNIAKKGNFGGLIRTANAFGVAQVVIVGRNAYRTLGACGTSKETPRVHFRSLDAACDYLRARECTICGVEIVKGAKPVETRPFQGTTAFLIGNETSGLSQAQIEQCDQFIYIPQFGTGASLNVNVATGIVLHHFAVWASFHENARNGSKFVPRIVG